MSNNFSFGQRSAAIVELSEGKFMDRRSFLKTSALGGTAAAASSLAAPAYATGKRVLTMVQSWPRGFAVLDDASSYYSTMIGEMSDESGSTVETDIDFALNSLLNQEAVFGYHH